MTVDEWLEQNERTVDCPLGAKLTSAQCRAQQLVAKNNPLSRPCHSCEYSSITLPEHAGAFGHCERCGVEIDTRARWCGPCGEQLRRSKHMGRGRRFTEKQKRAWVEEYYALERGTKKAWLEKHKLHGTMIHRWRRELKIEKPGNALEEQLRKLKERNAELTKQLEEAMCPKDDFSDVLNRLSHALGWSSHGGLEDVIAGVRDLRAKYELTEKECDGEVLKAVRMGQIIDELHAHYLSTYSDLFERMTDLAIRGGER